MAAAELSIEPDDVGQATADRHAHVAGLVAGFGAGTAVLVCIAAVVLILAELNSISRFELLREQVRTVAQSAAQLVDGDLHNKIRSPEQIGSPEYARAVAPLVKFHNANPDLFYVYTMIERDGRAYFILDTAADPRLKAEHSLIASAIMEEFEPGPDNEASDWLTVLRSGKSYVNPGFETDDYGTFISGHAPFYDSSGRYAGFVGIDVDADFFLKRQSSLDRATWLVLCIGLGLAMVLGVVVYRLYGETVRKSAEVEHLTLTDPLTGAWNRRGLAQRANQAFLHFKRLAQPCSVLVVDIDHFKRLNDTYGHAVGDEVLQRLVRVAERTLREIDCFARTGGEEFVALLAGAELSGATHMAERLRLALAGAKLPIADGGEVAFTVSIGVSSCRAGDASLDECQRRADSALYEAKRAGRNRVEAEA